MAFGAEYDKLAAHTACYSRLFTDLPICVVTNLHENHPKWGEISDIEFRYIALHDDENRAVKTHLHQHTPFAQTLYMDCDSVIQKPGVERAFDLMAGSDMLLFAMMRWEKGDKVLAIYKRTMQEIGCSLPMTIYHGGFQLFRNTHQVRAFYGLWHTFWSLTGRGRDMPALNCAVAKTSLKLKSFSGKDNIHAGEAFNPDAIIQHKYPGAFCRRFGIPEWVPNKPFDATSYGADFEWVDFD